MSQSQNQDPRKVAASQDLGVPYFEIAKTLANRVTRFASLEELPSHVGFRSYFGFSEAVKEYCIEVGSTRGMRGTVVYSDTIFLDFDNAQEAAEEFWNTLIAAGIGFTVWDSGGRSYHFHIPHAPMWSEYLPYSHAQWVLKTAVGPECLKALANKGLDMSLYQAGRIFRLPGTLHQKHLRRKELLDTVPGNMPEIELLVQPVASVSFGKFVADGDGVAELTGLLQKLARYPPQNGERNRKLYAAACSCLSCGFSEAFTLELVTKVNEDLMDDPIDEEELNLIVGSAVQSFGV